MKRCEAVVQTHQQYEDAHAECCEWLHLLAQQHTTCTEPSTDKHSIQSKLDRVKVCGGEGGWRGVVEAVGPRASYSIPTVGFPLLYQQGDGSILTSIGYQMRARCF